MTVKEIANIWGISERSVRNYCAMGKIDGAVLVGKVWQIPKGAEKPQRKQSNRAVKRTLYNVLMNEMENKVSGGIYHKIQIDLTYNSNRIEGSQLTHEETRYIFETNTIGIDGKCYNVDDIMETANHFKCIDIILQNTNGKLTEKLIKQLHLVLKSGTKDSRNSWFNVGEYKSLPNQVGGKHTAQPEQVAVEIKKLLEHYNALKHVTLEDIIDFHVKFENIHPFQDGNGRVGRLLMFKECIKHNIVPFIIDDHHKMFYYRGLSEWNNERGYLLDTCLSCQDIFKKYLEYFRIDN